MEERFDYELKEELQALKKRERIYLSIFSVVVALGLFFGWQSYQDQKSNYLSYDQYYSQPVNYTGKSTGSGGGGCCGGGGASTGPIDTTQVSADGLDYYIQQTGDKNVDSEVTDYGCHIQCDIVKDGEIIKSYTYRNGQFLEI